MGCFTLFIAFCIAVGVIISLFRLSGATEAAAPRVEDAVRRRERRDALIKLGVGLAARFMKK